MNDGDYAPKPRSIQSTTSKLDKVILHSITSANVLNGGYENLNVPGILPSERESGELMTHFYVGDVGSGKSVTARTHTLRLLEDGFIDRTVVLDVFGEWESTENRLDGVERVETAQPTDPPLEELVEKVHEQDPNDRVMVVIENVHYAIDKNQAAIEKLDEMENVSLRLIMFELADLPEALEPSVVHFHRMEPLDDRSVELLEDHQFEFAHDRVRLVENFPNPLGENTAYVLTIVGETGETTVCPNIVLEHETPVVIPHYD